MGANTLQRERLVAPVVIPQPEHNGVLRVGGNAISICAFYLVNSGVTCTLASPTMSGQRLIAYVDSPGVGNAILVHTGIDGNSYGTTLFNPGAIQEYCAVKIGAVLRWVLL